MTIQKRLARSNNVHLLNRGGVQYGPPEPPTLSEIKPEKEQAGNKSSCFYACGGGQIQHHN